MRKNLMVTSVVLITATAMAPFTAFAQDDAEKQLGAVHFATSCDETAQRRFNRGMRYQHSFWYRQSQEIFEEVLKADPDCAIAYWGIALSQLWNPHVPPPKENLALGLAALEKAKATVAKTQRERDYIDALFAVFADHDKVPHGQRVQRYLAAMEALAKRYPDDDEAQIGYAITLNVAASAGDKTYSEWQRLDEGFGEFARRPIGHLCNPAWPISRLFSHRRREPCRKICEPYTNRVRSGLLRDYAARTICLKRKTGR